MVRTFINRLMVLHDHLIKRFNERDSLPRKARRSVNGYHKLMTTKKGIFVPPTVEPQKGWWEFYRALHSKDAAGEVWMEARWEYPPLKYKEVPRAPPFLTGDPVPPKHPDNEFDVLPDAEDEPLPPNWQPSHEAEYQPPPARPPPAGNLDKRDDELPLPKGVKAKHKASSRQDKTPENRYFKDIAWNLVHAVRRIAYNEKSWGDVVAQRVISLVFRRGALYYPTSPDARVSVDNEVRWRREVFDEYGISEKARSSVRARAPPVPAPAARRAGTLAAQRAALMAAFPVPPPGPPLAALVADLPVPASGAPPAALRRRSRPL
jgi:hypothetical protein